MKNLMLFVHPSKDFLPEHKVSIKIEIDNILDLGWKASDIILATNFPYEYNGVKSILVSSDNYCADISPCASIINVIVELFHRKLIKKGELYWYHDTDAYELYRISESELNLGGADIGLVEIGGQVLSAGSIFFRENAKDIFRRAKEIMYKYRVHEERALNAVCTNNLLWATGTPWDARANFVPLSLKDSGNMQKRIKKLNIIYDFELSYINQYPHLSTMIKVAHFHFMKDRLLDCAMYGKNCINKPLIPERLIKIFHKHGVKGIRFKKMKNLMIYISHEKKFLGETEDLVKKQIDSSFELGWKKKDLILLTNFPYQYKGVKATVLDDSIFQGINDKAIKSNAIFRLLDQGIVKEAELWWFHDLDVFQLQKVDSSQINLEDTNASFTILNSDIDDGSGKFDTGNFFFRKDSDKIFEWIRNRACRMNSDEATAFMTLVAENFHNINSMYTKLNLTNNFSTRLDILKPPYRSPLVVIEALRPYIEGKVVCEIGSALGDISLRMKKYAKHVSGIEIDEKRAEYSKKRGLDTRYGNALDMLPLPDQVDVYYMWMDPEPTRGIFDAIGNGVVIMAGELEYGAKRAGYARGSEVKVLDEIHAENPGSRMIEFKYDEGDGDRQSGVWVLLVVEK